MSFLSFIKYKLPPESLNLLRQTKCKEIASRVVEVTRRCYSPVVSHYFRAEQGSLAKALDLSPSSYYHSRSQRRVTRRNIYLVSLFQCIHFAFETTRLRWGVAEWTAGRAGEAPCSFSAFSLPINITLGLRRGRRVMTASPSVPAKGF